MKNATLWLGFAIVGKILGGDRMPSRDRRDRDRSRHREPRHDLMSDRGLLRQLSGEISGKERELHRLKGEISYLYRRRENLQKELLRKNESEEK